MCCFMEKMLANLLADFEMKVEKEVLEPLNKLSEVTNDATPAESADCSAPVIVSVTVQWNQLLTSLPVCFSMKDDLPEILRNKKQFAKLTADWNNAKMR